MEGSRLWTKLTMHLMLCIRKHKNISGFKAFLLVANDEEGCGRVCGKMLNLSTGESRTSSSCGKIAIFKDTGMEMGEDNDGFYDWVATYILKT